MRFLIFMAAGVLSAAEFPKAILERNCLPCHSESKPAGGLAITSRDALFKSKAVVPGKPEASPLYLRSALPPAKPGAMPPGGPPLSAAELATLKQWIVQGADWPAGVTFTAAPAADGRETVRRIHDRIAKKAAAKPVPYSVTIPNTTVSYEMRPVPAGDFTMGAPDHPVHVDAFWMQAHEVTWDEYRLFMFANQAGETANKDETIDAVSRPTRPYVEMSFGMGINGYPAISMTQHAANKYAEWLSAKTGEFYRLPTEAEWEWACRGGASTEPVPLADYAWYAANSGGKYQQVAKKKPNGYGLYDMLGNVMEWTLDAYAPYPATKQVNPWVKATAPYPHVVRGGSWNDPADQVNCKVRVASDPSWKQQDPQLPKSIWYMTDAQWLGFRLVRPAKIPSADEMYHYWNSGVEHDEQ